MSGKFTPYDETELSIQCRHERHKRSEQDKERALQQKFRLRQIAAAARARALELERQAYRPDEPAITKSRDPGITRTGRASSSTQSDQRKDDSNSSARIRRLWSSSRNQARVSLSGCKASDPKVPWTRRFVESGRALLYRVKPRGHDARPSYTAVVPSCAEMLEGAVTPEEDMCGSRCEEATSVQSMSERGVEHRSSKLSRSMFGPRAAWFRGAKADVSKRDR
eukprot:TRINITY_DN22057_c0_g2_i1.p1 TRINITY_DN22057_c0_g2~~TRINITY_DN22057_c0_g2_i1.p1  ORF type:complete len:223 (+),score=17.59 TRINITY_DN22057_c0_g2_i1:68-736(+)